MSIEISPQTEARLVATAHAEGVSVSTFIERLMEEREEVAAIVDRAGARSASLSKEEVRARIERSFAQSERGEVVDGETFVGELLSDLDEARRPAR